MSLLTSCAAPPSRRPTRQPTERTSPTRCSSQIPEGEPPTRGPHFAVPQSVGVYQQQVPDGNTIHSLEHGIVWISYNPALADEDTVNQLEDLGDEFSADTIIAPGRRMLRRLSRSHGGRS